LPKGSKKKNDEALERETKTKGGIEQHVGNPNLFQTKGNYQGVVSTAKAQLEGLGKENEKIKA